MDKRIFGYYVFGGMLIGALFGLFGAARGTPLLGIATGAIAGAFLGWFVAAAVLELKKKAK